MKLTNKLLIGTAALSVLMVICYFVFRTPKMLAPLRGKITSKFGSRKHPITGVIQEHNGVDISAAVGTPVQAPKSGKVAFTNTTSTGGKQMVLLHDNNYQTGYAHLSAQLLKTGDKVSKGQIFAKTGNTGATTGAHLHLTVTNPKGVKIDPEKIFNF
jgi:murein DD-endopeptidase MepM/ murein hydrolase activator NlpD